MLHSKIEPKLAEAANPLCRLADVVQAVGTDGFYARLALALTDRAAVADFVVVQRGNSQPQAGLRFQQFNSPRRSVWHWPDDFSADCDIGENPICQALNAAARDGNFTSRMRPEDMKTPASRAKWFTRPGLSEALMLVQNCGGDLVALACFARVPASGFSAAQLIEIAQLAPLILPLLRLHFRLIGVPERDRWMSVDNMEHRVRQVFPELTNREISVCARSALGVTAEGIAIDLGIKKTSVLTYRRRAYQRLNVSSIHQLSMMLIQSSQPQQMAVAQ